MTQVGMAAPGLLAICLARGIVRRSFIVAVVVGTIINLINQGDALVGGAGLNWWKIALTYCVPYCVATYGAVSARLEMQKRAAVRA